MSESIGKIYDNQDLIFIFNTIIKTSQSGLFNNKRLAVMSVRQGIIGYNSKIPNNLQQYKERDCLNKCKDKINIRSANFSYFLKPDAPSFLNMKWKENTDKEWQFKFDSELIAREWYNYIDKFINPITMPSKNYLSKQQQQALKQSKLKQKLTEPSRFKEIQQKLSPINEDMNLNNSNSTFKRRFTLHQADTIQEHNTIQSIMLSPKMNQSRFAKYEEQNHIKERSSGNTTLPITTFREKFPYEQFFTTNDDQVQIEINQNWNTLWFEAIQRDIEQNKILIYKRFVYTCEKTCKEIINQLTALKKNRKYVPAKITNHEEVYYEANVQYSLMMERDFPEVNKRIYSEFKLKESRQILQNYKFILKATKNKGLIKVPLACIIEYYGFAFFCEAKMPFNYFEVDHPSKYLFINQINKLQQVLKIRINTVDFNFYTNKLAPIVNDSKSKQTYLIAKDIKNLLPLTKSMKSQDYFQIQKEVFIQSKQMEGNIKDENFYANLLKKNLHNFLKKQNKECKIISHQDLLQSLKEYKLSYALLDEILTKSQNKYLTKIIKTEHVSQIFCRIVRSECMIFIKEWNNKVNKEKKQTNYETLIYHLIAQLLMESSHKNKLWNIINEELFVKHQINLKQQDLIVGYLLTSISYKLGVQFNYELFIQQKQALFAKDYQMKTSTILKYRTACNKYLQSDISNPYHQLQYYLYGIIDEVIYHKVVDFYGLRSIKLQKDSYLSSKVYRMLSFFIPYGMSTEFNHLPIYKGNDLLSLDYNVYCIFLSSIKWLLYNNQYHQSIQMLQSFLSVQRFWLSQDNPFTPQIFKFIAEYNRIHNDIEEALKYERISVELLQSVYAKYADLHCLQSNLQLAKHLNHYNYHKESLQKYLQLKKIYKKYKKQQYFVVDASVQISRLYLHLGDIPNTIKHCKETIDLSTINMFKDEAQQYEIYQILLRALEIKDEHYKYKFYISIIQDKFHATNTPAILRSVFKLTIQEVLNTFNRYKLKKFMFYLYHIEVDMNQNQPQKKQSEKFKIIRQYTGKLSESACVFLRKCLQISVDLSDRILVNDQQEQPNKKTEMNNVSNMLDILCDFIGLQFIIGHIVILLQKSKNK